jgi:hypothetical protein
MWAGRMLNEEASRVKNANQVGGRDSYRGGDKRVPLVDADHPHGESVRPIRHEGGHVSLFEGKNTRV